ncbi:PEP-CTERM sorting domain-containing protein [Glaciimonas immobilis]|uniref:Legume lectin domain-containing protein n=1 Tax=Glaciimonas immobilis TaxID=728004 RepID=A0A840RRE0_9BURK|nr:PEP-CTERM sorting domain-containing protein [Glaciimonas immobilis]KAF3999792.1 PEP-CTERM sorting domain-containing protein [Glaciimonas immobilis]MBB5200263.1 hypothetical protein [Glaciimonas immobilis]
MRYLLPVSVVLSILFALPVSAAVGPATTFDGNSMNLINSQLKGGAIELTSSGNQHSAAWLTSGLSTKNSFSSTFNFSLAQNGSNPMADGITFALQNVGNSALGSTNGGNTLAYNGLNGVGSIIQTYTNNRLGLDTTGNASGAASSKFNLGSANLITGNETINYNAITHVLDMSGTFNVDGKNYAVSDTKTINLFTKFGSTMYAGFTGATGGATAEQKITSFTMSSVSAVPEPETYAMLLGGLALISFMVLRRKSS